MFKNLALIFGLIMFLSVHTGCRLLNPDTDVLTRNPDNLLFVEQSDRDTLINSDTRPMVDMKFASPSELGAQMYTLQQSLDDGSTWNNFQYYDEDLTTTSPDSDNFSINLNQDSFIRLLITGGEYDGMTSNEVEVDLSAIDTYFSNWGVSGVITSYDALAEVDSGHHFNASFTVKSISEDTVVDNSYLSYQWYRLDPDDYEYLSEIAGANTLDYTAVQADSGSVLCVRAVGDEVHAGGFYQILVAYVR